MKLLAVKPVEPQISTEIFCFRVYPKKKLPAEKRRTKFPLDRKQAIRQYLKQLMTLQPKLKNLIWLPYLLNRPINASHKNLIPNELLSVDEIIASVKRLGVSPGVIWTDDEIFVERK
eukprot:GHVP01062901.1.p1 GENE.GHVP01062901.1~~GHVP01062901.1.p1  ORF type:complete len:117 (+),score=14.24 GHVP01062901.1:85-435(+)